MHPPVTGANRKSPCGIKPDTRYTLRKSAISAADSLVLWYTAGRVFIGMSADCLGGYQSLARDILYQASRFVTLTRNMGLARSLSSI